MRHVGGDDIGRAGRQAMRGAVDDELEFPASTVTTCSCGCWCSGKVDPAVASDERLGEARRVDQTRREAGKELAGAECVDAVQGHADLRVPTSIVPVRARPRPSAPLDAQWTGVRHAPAVLVPCVAAGDRPRGGGRRPAGRIAHRLPDPEADASRFAAFLEELKTRGDRHAASRRRSAPGRSTGSTLLPVVVERDRGQAEAVLSIDDYVRRRLDAPAWCGARARWPPRIGPSSRKWERPTASSRAIWWRSGAWSRTSAASRACGPRCRPWPRWPSTAAAATLFRNELFDALRIVERGTRVARQPEGVVGRRHGPAAVHALELPALRRGLRRRRRARHLGQSGRCLRVDRQLPQSVRLGWHVQRGAGQSGCRRRPRRWPSRLVRAARAVAPSAC